MTQFLNLPAPPETVNHVLELFLDLKYEEEHEGDGVPDARDDEEEK